MLNLDDRLIREVSPKIGPNALSVLLAIAIHLNRKSGECFPAHESLMALTGMGKNAVYDALNVLKGEGILQVEQGVDPVTKKFGKRLFRVTTKFISIFVTADKVEPLPESREPVFRKPDSREPVFRETELINKRELINNTPLPPKGGKTPKPKKVQTVIDEIPAHLNTPAFTDLWATLLENPKWAKKPTSAVNLALKQLSRYHVDFAVTLLESAVAGDYRGVVFRDTPEAYKKWIDARQSTTARPAPNGATHHTANGKPTYGEKPMKL